VIFEFGSTFVHRLL